MRHETSQAHPQQQAPTFHPLTSSGILQRKCKSCGQHQAALNKCDNCNGQQSSPLSQVFKDNDTTIQRKANSQKMSNVGEDFSRIPITNQKRLKCQPKLKMGYPNDKYEKEADRVSEQAVKMSVPVQQLKIKNLEKEGLVQPKFSEGESKISARNHLNHSSSLLVNREAAVYSDHSSQNNLENKLRSVQQGGYSLPSTVQSFMESRFDTDFSQVRIHSDPQAAKTAEAINARAYTVGQHVVFGASQYAPDSFQGRQLLAHELTHVIQQTGGKTSAAAPQIQHEQEADRAANFAVSGLPTSVPSGTVQTGTPQLQDDDTAAQHEALPTPEEYIKNHTNYLGLNLQEAKLASDLFLLAWQSKSHYDFVLKVFKALDASNQTEVAEAFFKQLKSDSWLEDTALTATGRSFLTSIAGYLPEKHYQRDRLAEIVASGPQAEREQERKKAIETLKKKGNNVDITIYTEYKGMDTAEQLLGGVARKRLAEKNTDAAFPMEQFGDIQIYLKAVSKKHGDVTNFVRELHLMGHGTKDNFGFGRHFYSSDYLRKNYETGLNAKYMANGGTIYMEGCNVAKGEAGRVYLREVGRIFFGDKKTGYIKGNTCEVIAMGEITECGAKTFRWPNDFE